jgi:DNA-binding NarL/FixJ family response regulator
MAMGNTNKEIGKTLNLDERTIKNQVTLILAKLNASNRAHAVALAMQQGLVSMEDLKPARTASK